MTSTFPHQRLDCYRASIQLAVLCAGMLKECGTGHSKLRDNLMRSSEGVPLLIAEGVNRWTPGQRRQRFAEARGETGECAAALELGGCLGLFSADEVEEGMVLCGRITAMLTVLLKRAA